jgi:hypothetical protein
MRIWRINPHWFGETLQHYVQNDLDFIGKNHWADKFCIAVKSIHQTRTYYGKVNLLKKFEHPTQFGWLPTFDLKINHNMLKLILSLISTLVSIRHCFAIIFILFTLNSLCIFVHAKQNDLDFIGKHHWVDEILGRCKVDSSKSDILWKGQQSGMHFFIWIFYRLLFISETSLPCSTNIDFFYKNRNIKSGSTVNQISWILLKELRKRSFKNCENGSIISTRKFIHFFLISFGFFAVDFIDNHGKRR